MNYYDNDNTTAILQKYIHANQSSSSLFFFFSSKFHPDSQRDFDNPKASVSIILLLLFLWMIA